MPRVLIPLHGRLLLVLPLIALTLLTACGSSGDKTVDPADTVTVSTVTPRATAQTGGKPANPPGPTVTSQPGAQTSQGGRPTTGRWIDVDVTRYQVLLMEGTNVVKTIAPVAVGEQINTGAYLSTQTGLFHVYNKSELLAYDAPYDTYISHWVGFDPAKDNGFHSFLKDQTGKVVDAGTGKISNGCIRTGEAEALFAFAEIGMPVFVHS
jgi:hypothetical protein